MRFGVAILPDRRWTEAVRLWRHVEELGFDHACTYDHLSWRSLRDEAWFGAVPTLAAAALATSRVRLGTLVALAELPSPGALRQGARDARPPRLARPARAPGAGLRRAGTRPGHARPPPPDGHERGAAARLGRRFPRVRRGCPRARLHRPGRALPACERAVAGEMYMLERVASEALPELR